MQIRMAFESIVHSKDIPKAIVERSLLFFSALMTNHPLRCSN